MKTRIAIVGLGYVGLPLAIKFANLNHQVSGYDIDKIKIENLNKGKSYINHIKDKQLQRIKKNFCAYDCFSSINDAEFIVLCIPTPIDENKKPDLKYIKDTVKKIYPYLKKGQTISLESSTYPGCTNDLIVNKLNNKFNVGHNFFVVYSPEREDPASGRDLEKIPKVIGGYSKKCLKKGISFYSKVFKKLVPVSSLETAEMTKLLENIYRSVNIGMINEIKIISQVLGLNIFEVIKAAKTKPFGFKDFYPGPGVGGHCIPVDPYYLSWKAKKLGVESKFIELAGLTNDKMPKIILQKIKKIKKIKKILLLGITYKKNIDDYRESPLLIILNSLKRMKYRVDFHDPFVQSIKSTRKFKFNIRSKKINYENLNKYDAVIIGTDHDKINYSKVMKKSKLIFDLRGRYSNIFNKKIIQL